MRIENDIKLDFSDVLLRPKRSTLGSRSEVDLIREYNFKHSGFQYKGIPIIASNMDTIGTIPMARSLKKLKTSCVLQKHIPSVDIYNFFRDELSGDFIFYSMGITPRDQRNYKIVKDMIKLFSPFVCIDVANGYNESFIDFVKKFREENPTITIMAGNVVTPEITEQLILAGADIVKVGIGSGSVCTTRKITGVGYPQLSAVIECADAAHGLGGHICSDGGCVVPGDISKAFAGGADFVMLGGMLSGHDECSGESSSSHKEFYGMSSKRAQEKYQGEISNYKAAEGKSVMIPKKGPVEDTIREIMGGLRSTCTYVGATKLKELSKRATFIRVNRQLNTVYDKN